MQRVVREMNRLGMMVDISHVNNYTMVDVLDTTLAPGEWEGSQGRLLNLLFISTFIQSSSATPLHMPCARILGMFLTMFCNEW